MDLGHWQLGSDVETTLTLNSLITIDMAVHPTEGWPVVAGVVWSDTHDPSRVLVAVYNPRTRFWTPARQVDIGEAAIGHYARTVEVAVSGDYVVHAVWGMSNPDFIDHDPPAGIWYSASSDYGATWDHPKRIADHCRQVNDMAATPDGWLIVQLLCYDGAGMRQTVPAMVIRTPDGRWSAPERFLQLPVWYFAEGSVVVSGASDPATAQINSLVLSGLHGQDRTTAVLLRKRLSHADSWTVQTRPVTVPDQEIGERMWHVQGLAFKRPNGDHGVVFTWSDAEKGGAFAMQSLDGGNHWGEIHRLVVAGDSERIAWVAPAYDSIADRLVAIWTCCDEALFRVVPTTHFGSWNVPGTTQWNLALTKVSPPPERIPLVLGSRASGETHTVQSNNSAYVWVSWMDATERIEVRSLALNQIIPIDQYPGSSMEAEVP